MAKKKAEEAVARRGNDPAEEALARLMTVWGQPDRDAVIGFAVLCWESALAGSAAWVEKFFTSAEWNELAEAVGDHLELDDFAKAFRESHPASIRLSRKLESLDDVGWEVVYSCCSWLKLNPESTGQEWWNLEYRKSVEASKPH